MLRITVLISGGGTTLRNLLEHRTAGKLNAEIVQVISNNPKAGGIEFAEAHQIPVEIVNHRDYRSVAELSEAIFDRCRLVHSDLIVMGGFLRQVVIPSDFEHRVINIHPSLIPSFCGAGMYGQRVHQAVLDYGCKLTGCTVHFVDNEYDHGPIIAQRAVDVFATDSADTLARRVFETECDLYPAVINVIAERRIRCHGRRVEVELF